MRPYPKEWERAVAFGDQERVFVRPIRIGDELLLRNFLANVTPHDIRLRFFGAIKEFSDTFINQLTHLDYSRAIAFIALDKLSGEILGVVRLYLDSDLEAGEYAILVRSDLKTHGLGWKLMELIIEYSRHEGLKNLKGEVLSENTVMLQMCREMGFEVKPVADDATVCRVTLLVGTQPT